MNGSEGQRATISATPQTPSTLLSEKSLTGLELTSRLAWMARILIPHTYAIMPGFFKTVGPISSTPPGLRDPHLGNGVIMTMNLKPVPLLG